MTRWNRKVEDSILVTSTSTSTINRTTSNSIIRTNNSTRNSISNSISNSKSTGSSNSIGNSRTKGSVLNPYVKKKGNLVVLSNKRIGAMNASGTVSKEKDGGGDTQSVHSRSSWSSSSNTNNPNKGSSGSAGGSAGVSPRNPLKADGELRSLVGQLDMVQSYARFQRWRRRFLELYERFLGDEEALQKAKDAYNLFSKSIHRLERDLRNLLTLLLANLDKKQLQQKSQPELRKQLSSSLQASSVSVKAVLAQQELCIHMKQVCGHFNMVVPQTVEAEETCGYSKFHLGAVLVENGFDVYDKMKYIQQNCEPNDTDDNDNNDDTPTNSTTKTKTTTRINSHSHTNDRQQLELFEQFGKEVQKFVDVMADLGLFQVMKLSQKFAVKPVDEPEERPFRITVKLQRDSNGYNDNDNNNDNDHDAPTETVFQLEVLPTDSKGHVKELIEKYLQIPPKRQLLKSQGQRLSSFREVTTIEDLGLVDGCTLTVEHLLVPIHIRFVNGNTPTSTTQLSAATTTTPTYKTLRIDPHIKVSKLKQLISKCCHIAADNQTLYLIDAHDNNNNNNNNNNDNDNDDNDDDGDGREELTDDTLSADAYGITEGSVLDLEPTNLTVQVQLVNDDNEKEPTIYSVGLSPKDSMNVMKEKVYQATGLKPEHQIWNTPWQLNEGTMLQVQKRSTFLTVKCIDPSVRQSITVTLRVDPTLTVSQLKQTLADQSNFGTTVFQNADNILLTTMTTTTTEPTEQTEPTMFMLDSDSTLENLPDHAILMISPLKIRVYVETPDKVKHSVEVTPTDMIDSMKEPLYQLSGYAPYRLQWCFQKSKEESSFEPNKQTIRDLGICHGDTLMTELVKVPVTIVFPIQSSEESTEESPKTMQFMVEPTSTVAEFKQMLAAEYSKLEASNMTLLFNDTELVETTVPQSRNHLTPPPYQFTAHTQLVLEPKVISIQVSFALSDKSNNNETQAETQTQMYTLDVTPAHSIDQVKELLSEQLGIAAEKLVLFKENNNNNNNNNNDLPLASEDTLKSLGIRQGNTLLAEIYKVPVTVQFGNDEFVLKVEPSDTVATLKALLAGPTKISPDNMNLFWDNKKLTYDTITVPSQTLRVEPSTISVTLQTPKEHFKVTVSYADTTIATLYKMIQEESPPTTTKNTEKKMVMYHDDILLQNDQTVKSANLKDGDIVKVELYKVSVLIRCLDGQRFRLQIDPSQSLEQIKEQLQAQSGLSANNMKLFTVMANNYDINDQELTNNKNNAASAFLEEGTVWNLEPETITLSVQMPPEASVSQPKHETMDAKDESVPIVQVDIHPKDKVDAIKRAIYTKTNFAISRQVLVYDQKEMPRHISAWELGLRHSTQIQCRPFKIPVKVLTEYGNDRVWLDVEPVDVIYTLKQLITQAIGVHPDKQHLFLGRSRSNQHELTNEKTVTESGLVHGSVVSMHADEDFIIFVDVKLGTLFAVDRDVILQKKILTLQSSQSPSSTQSTQFVESTSNQSEKDGYVKAMMESKYLGFNPRVVVQGKDVEDYDIQNAASVASLWGVSLKKVHKNKKGEEFLFFDPKLQQCGELSRQHVMDQQFITPYTHKHGQGLKEAETNTNAYDRYINQIRHMMGVKSLSS